jgi:hypothetical protein
MRFELFESDGSRWLCKNCARTNNVGTCWKEEEEEFILYSVVKGSDFIG